ncbi:MAG: Na+/H+ antiporter subunit E [Chloroflexota bacterium]|nr:Na+/H+ antiporter subunit E [Chloroflexota bacterium]
MMRFVATTVALTAVYTLALASADPWDLGIGAAIAVGVLLTFRRFLFADRGLPPRVALQRAVFFPLLALGAAANITRGTVQVTRVVLGWTTARQAGFVEIPTGDRTDVGVVVSGMLDTLSPGSVLVDIDSEAETWTIHALDAKNPDTVREDVDRFYERFQRPVWP